MKRRFAQHGSWLLLCTLLIANPGFVESKTASTKSAELFRDDFEAGLTRWEINDPKAITRIDSGQTEHGKVMRLAPGGARVYALIRGSAEWRGYRIEGEVLFPDEQDNYLGLIYHYKESARRVDLGSIYIKGNESYIRVNPRRDWNPSRALYEEYRTALKGDSAIRTQQWQRFAAEVVDRICHFYVGDLQTPKVTFDLYEGDTGKAGFKPREVGGAVWIDNIRVTALAQLSYRGPRLPAGINYQPENLVTDWGVLGPLTKAMPEIEAAPSPVAVAAVSDQGAMNHWRRFATDSRGAVVTGQVTEYTGSRTVAYFATTIRVEASETATLQFSTADNLAVWRNGKFEGYFDRDQFAWHDFGKSPKHPPEYAYIRLAPDVNQVLVRVRGGQYATGGFFARVVREEKREANLSRHAAADRDPAWSPDGKRIAFVSDRDGNFEIYVMNADGSGQRRLTTNSAADRNPAWSRDGKQLIFQSKRDGNEEIYLMNADGSRQTRLTSNAGDDIFPDLSPDGTKITFTSNRNGNLDIFVMNADGSQQTPLTNHAHRDVWSRWSPDGRRLTFFSRRDSNDDDDEIYVMNADGNDIKRLTENRGHDFCPDWSADGKQIAFVSIRENGQEYVYRMNTDGSALERVTNTPDKVSTPSWSPDGSRIAFSSQRDGNFEVYVAQITHKN